MTTLFVAWQNPIQRNWIPVGRLSAEMGVYQFVYTRGAQAAKERCDFEPLLSFPRLMDVYKSDILFPLFSNRLLSPSRPDYPDYVEWMNLPHDQADPITMLARSGGRKQTDTLELFPSPEPDDQGRYHLHFFAHGLRHLPDAAVDRIARLHTGERLLAALDFQNPHDPHALLLRSNGKAVRDSFIVGYCPGYLLDDLLQVVKDSPGDLHIEVERLNSPPAPLQLRLLCSVTATWPAGFTPFASEPYQPLPGNVG